jgi:NADH-quinone oxidoreductase subunit H
MKFGLFYAGELLHALTIGALFAALFLGGWSGPGVEAVPVLGIFYLFIKAFFIYWVIMWVKYSLPRLRIDHMLNFNWKFLTPFALALVMVTAIADKALEGANSLTHTLVLLGLNIVLIWGTMAIVRRFAAKERKRVGEPKPVARPPQPVVAEQS